MKEYRSYLKSKEFSERTIEAYCFSAKQLQAHIDELSDKALLDHKEWLASNYSISTANARIAAINTYLEFIKFHGIRLKSFKVQQRYFHENVISASEYEHLRDCLQADQEYYWYFIVRFLACTGARISELRKFVVDDVKRGYMDYRAKGDKLRRVYIAASLQKDALSWIEKEQRRAEALFAKKDGRVMTSRGISLGLKRFAGRYGINPDVVYPHSFRHFFAKRFMQNTHNITLLSDLLGHESVETTRIYVRLTSEEQRKIVDDTVAW